MFQSYEPRYPRNPYQPQDGHGLQSPYQSKTPYHPQLSNQQPTVPVRQRSIYPHHLTTLGPSPVHRTTYNTSSYPGLGYIQLPTLPMGAPRHNRADTDYEAQEPELGLPAYVVRYRGQRNQSAIGHNDPAHISVTDPTNQPTQFRAQSMSEYSEQVSRSRVPVIRNPDRTQAQRAGAHARSAYDSGQRPASLVREQQRVTRLGNAPLYGQRSATASQISQGPVRGATVQAGRFGSRTSIGEQPLRGSTTLPRPQRRTSVDREISHMITGFSDSPTSDSSSIAQESDEIEPWEVEQVQGTHTHLV